MDRQSATGRGLPIRDRPQNSIRTSMQQNDDTPARLEIDGSGPGAGRDADRRTATVT